MFNRNSAGFIELDERHGGVRYMLSVGSFMELHTDNSIVKLRMPEDIDPKNTNPNLQPEVRTHKNQPFNDPINIAIVIQPWEIVNSMVCEISQETKNTILLHLIASRDYLYDFSQTVDEIINEINSISGSEPEDIKVKGNHLDIPQIENLATRTENALSLAKKYLRSLMKTQRYFFDLETPNEPRFDKLIKSYSERFGKNSDFLTFLKASYKQIKLVIDMRNAIEHPEFDENDPKCKWLRINDFTLEKDSSILCPTFDFSTKQKDSPITRMKGDLKEMLETTKFNLLFFGELFLLHSCDNSINKQRGALISYISKVPEEEVSSSLPVKYKLNMVAPHPKQNKE